MQTVFNRCAGQCELEFGIQGFGGACQLSRGIFQLLYFIEDDHAETDACETEVIVAQSLVRSDGDIGFAQRLDVEER